MKRRTVDLSALVAATIMAAPSSVKQICCALGVADHRSDIAMQYVRAFRAQRLVYVSGYSNRRRPIYAWQPEPGRYSDAVRPEPKEAPRPDRVKSQPHRACGVGPRNVFELGAQV